MVSHISILSPTLSAYKIPNVALSRSGMDLSNPEDGVDTYEYQPKDKQVHPSEAQSPYVL